MAHIPAAAPPVHRDDRRVHTLCALAGRADCAVDRALGPQRLRVEQLQPGRVQPVAEGPVAGDAGVAGAEEYLPELACRLLVRARRGDFFALDYGYGVPGVCQ